MSARPIDTVFRFDLKSGGERAVGFDAVDERLVLVERPSRGAATVKVHMTVDQAFGLAEATLSGNPTAITRPTAQLELATACLALFAVIFRPDLVPAFLGGSQPPAAPDTAAGPGESHE